MNAENDLEPLFACPACRGEIREACCQTCGFVFARDENGIFRLTANREFYFREKMPREALQRINRSEDIHRSCYQVFKQELQWKYDFYALDHNRGVGTILCRLHPDAVVLDYGAGWGNLTKFMSHFVGHVFSMDMTYESLHFCQRTGERNITCLHGGDGVFLPFRDRSLDLVVLNGVLEWIPEYLTSGDPREVQLAFLREARRVLKSGGQIFIGIEHRYGWVYFRGLPDEHTELEYATLLPRSLADRVSMRRRQKPYRTYTYSRDGYRTLLEEAGFADIGFATPDPDYRDIVAIHPAQTPWRDWLEGGLRRSLPHSFLIRSNAGVPGFVESVLAANQERGLAIRAIENRNHKSVVVVRTDRTLYKIPTAPFAARRLRHEAMVVERAEREGGLRDFLPWMRCLEVNGVPVQAIGWLAGEEQPDLALLEPFFALQQAGVVSMPAKALLDCPHLESFLDFNDRLPLHAELEAFLGDEPVACAFAHGDLQPGHLLADPQGALRIIDWSMYAPSAPLHGDRLRLLLGEEERCTGQEFDKVAMRLLLEGAAPSPGNRFAGQAAWLRTLSAREILLILARHLDGRMGCFANTAAIFHAFNHRFLRTVDLIDRLLRHAVAARG
ncbi:MAG: methyltransferase domain-containing protein [Magnetococcales bacterium]|nr:methyltransferase domain-containing protein [Magnetococcales bacterium]